MDNNHVARPDDDNAIGETAGRLMHQFTEVPALSLTAQQACRLVSAEGAVCRVALDQLVAAGWLARARDGQYTRAATVAETIETLIDRGRRQRRRVGSRGQCRLLPLSVGEAFTAILLAAARADGRVTSAEANRLEDVLASMRLYCDCGRSAPRPLVEQLIHLLAERGDPVIVYAAAAALPPELKASVLALAADIVLVDGGIRSGERQLLDDLQRELELDNEIAGKIFDVVIIKNRT